MNRDEGATTDERLRLDRWLWCARLFKSRSSAAEAVHAGHVRLNDLRVKPAHAVRIGDSVHVAYASGVQRDMLVTGIPLRRGPASEAAKSYAETAESVERGRSAARERAFSRALAPPTLGRPDKRTRRLLLRVRQRGPLNP